MVKLKKEDLTTGVVYKITNTVNNKIYIGRANSFEKHGKKKPSKYGASGRLRRHLSNAHSENKKLRVDIPVLYEAMREHDRNSWKVETLLVCSKDELKDNETKLIKQFNSHDPKIGYNYLIGDNKPENSKNKKEYEDNKIASNRNRAKNSAMKRTEISKTLPTNIYYRKSQLSKNTIEGYFVQIKINGKYKSKAFMAGSKTMSEKLDLAKAFLAEIKKSNNLS
jgi:hypothetical protein